MSTARKKTTRKKAPKAQQPAAAADPIESDFGPGPVDAPPASEPRSAARGFFPGVACGGEACVLKPVGDLFSRFAFKVVRGHGPSSLSRLATSGLELMRALRDFLDEEIALAEGAAARGEGDSRRYSKIDIE